MKSRNAAAVGCSDWFAGDLLREQALAVVKGARTFSPADILETVEVPEANLTNPIRPRLTAGKVKIVSQVVRKIESVMNDISLVYREYRVASQMRLIGHHSMNEDRDQFRSACYQFACHVLGIDQRIWPGPPLIEPKAIVFDIEQNALPWEIEPISQV